jgi:hypothetical protein
MTRPVFDVMPPLRPRAVCAACGGVAHGTVTLAIITNWRETRTDRDLGFCRHCIAQLAAGLTVDAKVWEEDHL